MDFITDNLDKDYEDSDWYLVDGSGMAHSWPTSTMMVLSRRPITTSLMRTTELTAIELRSSDKEKHLG